MKHILLALMLMAAMPIGSRAQDSDYLPFVVEGKRWTYDDYTTEGRDQHNHFFWYELKGDTVVAGKTCLKLYSENRLNDGKRVYMGALYEDAKKVYFFPNGSDVAEMKFNFDCATGDVITLDTEKYEVADIAMMHQDDISYRRYELRLLGENTENLPSAYWIEGVGSMRDLFLTNPSLIGNYCSLYACEVNGQKLYKKMDPPLTDEGYHKMGIEGKTWNYIHHYEDGEGMHEEPYSYVVRGDTLFGRTTFKKVYYQKDGVDSLAFMLIEHDGRIVEKKFPGEDIYTYHELFNFSRTDIGRVHSWQSRLGKGMTYWMLQSIDTVTVSGTPFRRFTCYQKYIADGKEDQLSTIEDGSDVWHEIWVEGVGSQYKGIESSPAVYEPWPESATDYTRFVSCYENSKCIFTAEDFYTKDISGIEKTRHSVTSPSVFFDLQGRRLTSKPAKGVYIQQGKKMVVGRR